MTDYSWGDGPLPVAVRRKAPATQKPEKKPGWFNWSLADAKFAFFLSFGPAFVMSMLELTIARGHGNPLYLLFSVNALQYGVVCLFISLTFIVSLRWRMMDGNRERLLYVDSYYRTFLLIAFVFVISTLMLALVSPLIIFFVVVSGLLWIPGLFTLGMSIQKRGSESGGMAAGMFLGAVVGIVCAGFAISYDSLV